MHDGSDARTGIQPRLAHRPSRGLGGVRGASPDLAELMVAFTQVAAGVEDAHRALMSRVEALVEHRHAPAEPPGTQQPAGRAEVPVYDGVTTLACIERQVVLATLDRCGGHRQRTARALGIGVRTLGMKLRAWKDAGIIAETR